MTVTRWLPFYCGSTRHLDGLPIPLLALNAMAAPLARGCRAID